MYLGGTYVMGVVALTWTEGKKVCIYFLKISLNNNDFSLGNHGITSNNTPSCCREVVDVVVVIALHWQFVVSLQRPLTKTNWVLGREDFYPKISFPKEQL